MIRILHIISGLGMGGSEMLLYKLLAAMDRTRFSNTVVSLTDMGATGPKIAALGVDVHVLDMRGLASGVRGLRTTVGLVRSIRPHVIQTWLHHADLFGTIASLLSGNVNLAWSLQCAALTPADVPARNLRLVKILRWISALPRVVISVSEAGRVAHAEAGYRPRRWEVIPNCFDTCVFFPDQVVRARVRAQLGIDLDDPIIGIIGRYHVMKGHALFMEAAKKLVDTRPDVIFLMAGREVNEQNRELTEQVKSLGLTRNVRLLGIWPDISELMNALDVLTISSTSEGFPTVLGEAMACAVPCVATDVGDCRAVVGGTGRVVAPGDAAALTRAWDQLLELPAEERQSLGRSARARIEKFYAIDVVVARYQSLYEELAGAG